MRALLFCASCGVFLLYAKSIRPVELSRCGGGFGGSLTHSDFSDFLPQASPQIDNKKLRTPCAPDCVFYNHCRPAAPELMPAKGIFVGPRGSMGWRNLWVGRNPWRRAGGFFVIPPRGGEREFPAGRALRRTARWTTPNFRRKLPRALFPLGAKFWPKFPA